MAGTLWLAHYGRSNCGWHTGDGILCLGPWLPGNPVNGNGEGSEKIFYRTQFADGVAQTKEHGEDDDAKVSNLNIGASKTINR